MKLLTQQMIKIIENFPLGMVASVDANGFPAVSPKETFSILNGHSLVFGNIRSPGTLANIQRHPYVEINFADVLTRRVVRIKGEAKVFVKDSERGQNLLLVMEKTWSSYIKVMSHFVEISIIQTQLINSPAYDVGYSCEELCQSNFEILQKWVQKILGKRHRVVNSLPTNCKTKGLFCDRVFS